MTKIEIEIHDDVISVVNKIKNIQDSGIELVLPEGAVIFDNIINLKIINKIALDRGFTLQFTTKDEKGRGLIDSMDEAVTPRGFDGATDDPLVETETIEKPRKKITMPKLKIPKIKIKFGLILIPILLGGIGYGAYKYLESKHQAITKIYIDAQPLTRSITIRISSTQGTSTENKILKGDQVSTTIDNIATLDTTGEKIEGEKAEGKVKIYNKTSEEIKLKEGKELVYEDDDDNQLIFKLVEEVTIPEMAAEDPTDPGSSLIPGEVEVKIEAEKIGYEHNIDKEEELEIEDYDKDDLVAETTEDFEGGKSETVKVVSAEDISAIEVKIIEENEDNDESILKSKAKKVKFVTGSTTGTVAQNTFSHEIGDETDKLTLTQDKTLLGLTYKQEDLDTFLDQIVADLVPEGFELSEGERETKVEIMGNSSNSTLNSEEADVQVTLKTFIVPKIDVENLKNNLQGVSPSQAEKILGSISNIETYEFSIVPSVPLLHRVPKDLQKINIEIVMK